MFNNDSNMLTAFQGKKLSVWTLPSIVFIDKNLLPQTNIDMGVVENLGRSACIVGYLFFKLYFILKHKIIRFIGNTITVRRSDGCLLVFYVSPFVSSVLRCVRIAKWDQAVRICRNAKVKKS